MKRLLFVLTLVTFALSQHGQAGWWQTFGGPNIDWGSCVQQTSDGGFIVTGYTYSFGNVGNGNIWLIKLDSLGHTEWTKTYGEGEGSNVWQTSDGGFVIGGSKLIRTNENGDTLWTRPYAGNCIQPTEDGGYIITSGGLRLMKVGKDGDSLWARIYKRGNLGEDEGRHVEQTTDGGYIVTGLIGDTSEMMYKSAIWLLKTDANGDTLWTRIYGGQDWDHYDRGNSVRQCSDGGYVIAGTFVAEGKLYSLLKTDANGDSVWKGIRGGEFYCVEETKDGGFIVAGATEWATLFSEPASGDLWLVKTDANGDTVWTRKYGGNELEAGRYVQQITDSGYIVVGYTGSYGAGGYDVYLLKTDPVGLLSILEDTLSDSHTNWWIISPVGSCISLSYINHPQGFNASIYDAAGRKVDELCSNQPQGAITWGGGFPPGVYFIQANETKHTSMTKVVLIH